MMQRRNFLRRLTSSLLSLPVLGLLRGKNKAEAKEAHGDGEGDGHLYGMGIQADKCIGCARCMEACKTENDVPRPPFFFRTWVERYIIRNGGHEDVIVSSIGTYRKGTVEGLEERDIVRSFFVPKLCNQCENPPCAQVCPVRATFKTHDGVILVDADRCIGCRYCIQACPYGARYLHPETHTADKCTFCYHRISQGLLPACVEVCPTQARIFGDAHSAASPLTRLKRMNTVHVLKAHLNTEPKVFYTNLDGEVR